MDDGAFRTQKTYTDFDLFPIVCFSYIYICHIKIQRKHYGHMAYNLEKSRKTFKQAFFWYTELSEEIL